MYDPFANYDQWKTSGPDEDYDDSDTAYADTKVAEGDMVTHLKDLGVKCFSADPDLSEADMMDFIKKWLYRGTSCGAWIEFSTGSVSLGSIVEGSDAEVYGQVLKYPFSQEEFSQAIEEVEEEAEILWNEANSEDDEDFDEEDEE